MSQTEQESTQPNAPEEKRGGASDTVSGIVVFLVGALVTTYLFLTNGDPKGREAYWVVNNGLLLWLPLCTILLLLRRDLSEYGMQLGDARFGFRIALAAWAVMLIGVAFASTRPEFKSYYIGNNLESPLEGTGPVLMLGRVSYPALVYYELAMGFYMFCWEFFFRGFLLFGIARTRLGPIGAVILQTIPFALLHWSWNANAAKPGLETLGAIPAGLILGWFALRTRSFLYGFLAHWTVSATLDLFLLAPFIFRHIG